jgi:hypothetical protein
MASRRPHPGATHEIGAVDQPVFRSAFSLEDACSSEALMMTYDLSELKMFSFKLK